MNKNIRLILASASPRRHELLQAAGLIHSVIVSDADESVRTEAPDGVPFACHYAAEASRMKGEAVCAMLSPVDGIRTFIISADTVVSSDMASVLGKPKGKEDARRMISSLSGGTHYVIGGLTVSELSGKSVTCNVITEVTFATLTEAEIDAYISTNEPYDKAGAYGIQGIASLFAEKVNGDYANVVGISVAQLRKILTEEFNILPQELIG